MRNIIWRFLQTQTWDIATTESNSQDVSGWDQKLPPDYSSRVELTRYITSWFGTLSDRVVLRGRDVIVRIVADTSRLMRLRDASWESGEGGGDCSGEVIKILVHDINSEVFCKMRHDQEREMRLDNNVDDADRLFVNRLQWFLSVVSAMLKNKTQQIKDRSAFLS